MSAIDRNKRPKCHLCDNEAITTAAHIPVCEKHNELYVTEAEMYYNGEIKARSMYEALSRRDARIYGSEIGIYSRCRDCGKEATQLVDPNWFCDACKPVPDYQVVVMLTDQDGYNRPIIVAPSMELASKAFGEFIQIHKDNSYWRLNTQEYKAVPHVTESPNSARPWFKNTGD